MIAVLSTYIDQPPMFRVLKSFITLLHSDVKLIMVKDNKHEKFSLTANFEDYEASMTTFYDDIATHYIIPINSKEGSILIDRLQYLAQFNYGNNFPSTLYENDVNECFNVIDNFLKSKNLRRKYGEYNTVKYFYFDLDSTLL